MNRKVVVSIGGSGILKNVKDCINKEVVESLEIQGTSEEERNSSSLETYEIVICKEELNLEPKKGKKGKRLKNWEKRKFYQR